MASSPSNNTAPPLPPGNGGGGGVLLRPEQQSLILLGPTGQANITVPLLAVDTLWGVAASSAISYGSQIGASFTMLVVLLVMTPKHRFKRLPTVVHTLALTLNVIRMVLLALFFSSSWMDLYTLVSGDYQFVAQGDYDVSVTATVFSIPVTVLVELALFLQAWSMLQLWPRRIKVPAAVVSALLVLATVAFNAAVTVIQSLFIVYGTSPLDVLWIRKTYLALTAASITWFCFLFNSRLVVHMWTNRSILPSLKGLNAMDVLVITNGILMLVPG